ncbi:hypothetical protein GYH30_025138 [Glycine max]|nr:hypothetical protein GYH30_025138 [Glycine max]
MPQQWPTFLGPIHYLLKVACASIVDLPLGYHRNSRDSFDEASASASASTSTIVTVTGLFYNRKSMHEGSTTLTHGRGWWWCCYALGGIGGCFGLTRNATTIHRRFYGCFEPLREGGRNDAVAGDLYTGAPHEHVVARGLRHLDPNRKASKKALEHKKEIAKHLGPPHSD